MRIHKKIHERGAKGDNGSARMSKREEVWRLPLRSFFLGSGSRQTSFLAEKSGDFRYVRVRFFPGSGSRQTSFLAEEEEVWRLPLRLHFLCFSGKSA